MVGSRCPSTLAWRAELDVADVATVLAMVTSLFAAEHERRLHQAGCLTIQELSRLASEVGHVDCSALFLCLYKICKSSFAASCGLFTLNIILSLVYDYSGRSGEAAVLLDQQTQFLRQVRCRVFY